MNFGSLYARLRLTASATQAEIKSAYYRLSKLYHPDKNNDCPKATIQFRNITEAYEVLSDSTSKAAYDKGYCDLNKCLVNYAIQSNLVHSHPYLFIPIAEHFPRNHLKGPSNRFRSSYRRRRFQDNPENKGFEEFDSPIQERMKQYRVQVENKSK